MCIVSESRNIAKQLEYVRLSALTHSELYEEIGLTAKQAKEYGLTKQDIIKEIIDSM